jgi:mannose-6-phosphate isomerase-like protein (cupin superfamily)
MVEIVEGRLPPGARIAYPALPANAYDQHILGQDGVLTFECGDERFAIHAGDCLHCTLGQPHAFANETAAPCRYLVIIARRRPS